MSLKSR